MVAPAVSQSPPEIMARISPAPTLEEALSEAARVQENTPELLSTKVSVFKRLDDMALPDAVLASSTSALPPSRLTENLKGRGRCIVVHPINPPYLIPAAEVAPAPWTSAETLERTRKLLVAAGHVPLGYISPIEFERRSGLALLPVHGIGSRSMSTEFSMKCLRLFRSPIPL